MKKVLITGANSYIGTSFHNWIKENEPEIETDKLSLRDDAWKGEDFSKYDSIFHCVGKAHVDVDTLTEEVSKEYFKINCDLAYETALKAKKEGVKQFIYLSSIIVYGDSAPIGKSKIIDRSTPLTPANFYGESKVAAEEKLATLCDDTFKVVIVRPPMIYGKGSKGNYPTLAKFARKLPLFPGIENSRSMLYIGNLCKFLSLMVLGEESGIFFPQNKEYVSTSDMVKKIAQVKGRKIGITPIFNPLIKLIAKGNNKYAKLASKAFGNLCFDKDISAYKEDYCIYDLETSIRLTEE